MKCPTCGKEDYRKFPALLIKTCFDCFAAPLIKAELVDEVIAELKPKQITI